MEPRVIYNGACPICSREVEAYARYCAYRDLPIRFDDLNLIDLSAYGIDEEAARRQLHVLHDGRVVAGLPAFLILWEAMPRFRILARLLRLPVIRPLAAVTYDRLLAPALYAMDRRRRRIACRDGAR
jgi:predicted DCC family thiol-disulfide oxidoreductase YuxK